jgi:hypothetical protein
MSIEDKFSEYRFRAVLQRTGLELINELEDCAPFEEGVTFFSNTTHSKVSEMMLESFEEANNHYECEDSVSPAGVNHSLQEALLSAYPGKWNCDNLTVSDCDDSVARAFCPEWCGCSNGTKGVLDRTGCTSACNEDVEGAFESDYAYWNKVGGCKDNEESAAAFERYFHELTLLFYEKKVLTLENGNYFPSQEKFTGFAISVYFDKGIQRNGTNFSLDAWAKTSYSHFVAQSALTGTQQAMSTPCMLISFVYKFFGFDACEADTVETAYLEGKIGALRHLCPKTCGYCDTPQSTDYQTYSYVNHRAWMMDAGINVLLNLNDEQSQCEFYMADELSDWKSAYHPKYTYWCSAQSR